MKKTPTLEDGEHIRSRKSVHVKHLVIARCIHAAVTRSAAWEATATALTTPPRAASTVVGGRSAAIGMQCAAPATAAVTVSRMDLPSLPESPARDSNCSDLP